MLYRAIADVTVVVHLAFIAYVVVGGFVAWKWPRTIWLHACAAAWGLASVAVGIDCPLTALENWARVHSGGAALVSTGFIDQYLTGVIYPDSALAAVRVAVAVTVVASWAGFVVLRTRSRTVLRLGQ
ncbi:DUF2784 domain-containing protein [Rhodococcus sp. RS1C4]|uniref:DUF2784 domain-containing protein n=1 Tax=Nocardiaceae TaxID=85025 RepID=UPI0003794972|nr:MULTISPECIES: DUF2784 domain-containing protein [Rhodococcus]OZC46223.1 DUF2784 domain-containing protein [Rhodococcus sp. RS1C4]OZC89273.1 DUF2784 domain-containing protein [Rhodococcus sp. 06-418-1B]OZD05456.1 DUF2784 domain-containing protein [Rhodococcus sp. 06-156-4C]OZD16568.1 DUF2784 domain-containing protein [Rhodococcus sp. 06-156-4a]OZD26426.1 DUF2784 domain-containing protein [Rhodococcus sp. 06-156-3C]